MKLYIVWYRDFWARCEILDSIWTDEEKAISRKENITFDFDEFDDFDKYSAIQVNEVEADCVGIDLNLDTGNNNR